ncbi:MAG TPA: hypothetical protein ENK48_00900 [Gammaproteobacteria bacterium]|nr:hypothetical protein [Gammaproteobacteria bacterium]
MLNSSLRLAVSGLLLLWAVQAGAVLINEIRIDQPGADRDEYFELMGGPGESLDGLTYLVIGDGRGGSGVIEAVVGLDGLHLSPGGLALVAESGFSLGPVPDRVAPLNFENGDNVTHLLVRGFTGSLEADLDTDDDGILDSRPWAVVLDSIALVDDPLGGDRFYGPTAGPEAGRVPSHVFRDWRAPGGWRLASALGTDTPGAPNPGVPFPPAPPPPQPATVDAPSPAWLLLVGGLLMAGLRPGRPA